MFRSFAVGLLAGLLVFAPVASNADPLALRAHSSSATLTPSDGSFSSLHTSTGASATIELTFPDCIGDDNDGNSLVRGSLGSVWLVAATAQTIELVPGSGDEFILNGTGITAGDEVDLAAGEFAIVVCTVAGKVYVESAGGADGGAAD